MVHAARERLLEPDHPDLLAAKQGMAVTLVELGDLEGAREPPAEAAEIASAPNAPQPSRITPALSAQAARKIGAPQREPDPPLGVWVEIVDTNDRLHMGTLLIAGGEEIVIRRPLQGGSASYAIPRREVVSIYARGWRR